MRKIRTERISEHAKLLELRESLLIEAAEASNKIVCDNQLFAFGERWNLPKRADTVLVKVQLPHVAQVELSQVLQLVVVQVENLHRRVQV